MSVALLLYSYERRSVNVECLKLGHASNFLYSLAVAVMPKQTLCLVPVVRCHQQSHWALLLGKRHLTLSLFVTIILWCGSSGKHHHERRCVMSLVGDGGRRRFDESLGHLRVLSPRCRKDNDGPTT